MSRVTTFLAGLAALTTVAVLSGCCAADDSAAPAPSDQSQAAEDASDAGHEHGEQAMHAMHAEADPQIQEALAQLPDEDRAAAEKQKICPVSLGPLGGMGKPYKVTLTSSDGQQHDVFLCCQGCEDAIKKDPDKYVANLTK